MLLGILNNSILTRNSQYSFVMIIDNEQYIFQVLGQSSFIFIKSSCGIVGGRAVRGTFFLTNLKINNIYKH